MADVKRLQIRRDTLADWVSVNPILLEGEVGLIIENGRISSLKIGDGVSSFVQLPQLTLLEAVFGGYVSLQELSASLRDYATIQYVDSEIGKILGGASGAYDTLKEIEDILKNDTTGLAALLKEIGTKADTRVVDALAIRVSQNESNIADHANKITANTNNIDNTIRRVATNEADLKQLNQTVDKIYGEYVTISDIPTTTSQLIDDIGYALARNIKALAGLDIVTKDYIDDAAVTTSKIKDGAITTDKLSTAIQQQLRRIPSTTDDLPEGSSNLYFTNDRAISAVSPRLEKVENGLIATQEEVRGYSVIISELQGTVGLKADQSSVDSLAEAIEAINEGIADLTTDDVYEGSNKYFTNARAIAALSDTLKGYVTTLAFQDYAVQIQQNSTNITNLNKTVDKIYEEYVTWDNIPTKTSQLINDSNFITSVTDALGYTPYNSANFTKANIKSTLGISDWALASSKPTYTADEVGALSSSTVIPNSTIVSNWGFITEPTLNNRLADYLPLSGGTVSGAFSILGKTTGDSFFQIGNSTFGGVYFFGGIAEGEAVRIEAAGSEGAWLGQILRLWQSGDVEVKGKLMTFNGNRYIHSGNISDYTLAKDSNGTVSLYGDIEVLSADNSVTIKNGSIISNTGGTDFWSIDDSGNGVFSSLKVGGSNVALASDLSGYLPLSGGTLNNFLRIQLSSGDNPLFLHSSAADASGACRIYFEDGSNAFQGYVMTGWGNLILSHRSNRQIGVGDSGIWCSTDNGTTKHTLIHSGNIGSQSVAKANVLARHITITADTIDSFLDISGIKMCNLSSYTAAGWGSGDGMIISIPWNNLGYGAQIAIDDESNYVAMRAKKSGTWLDWRPFAFLDSTVAAANKLSTARTIWGQNFDGSWNIDGNLSLSTSKLYWHNDADNYAIYSYYDGANTWLTLKDYGNIRFFTKGQQRVLINSSGNVGIGTTNPNTKLHVVGGSKVEGGLTVGSSTDYIAYDGSSLTGYKSSSSAWSIDPSGNGSFASLTVGGNAVLTQGALTSINSSLNNKANTADVIPWSATHNYASTVNPNVLTSPVSDRWYLVVKAAGNGNRLMVNVPWVNTTYDLSSYLKKEGGAISGSLTFSATSGSHIIGNANNVLQLQPGTGSAPVLPIKIAKLSSGRHTIYCDEDQAYDLGTSSYSYYYVYSRYSSASSDATKKNIIGNIPLTTAQIANAPAVSFTWKDSGEKSHGTIAQYWKEILPEFVSGEEGSYGLNYAALGVVSSIILARNIETHEQRIARLENEKMEMKAETVALKAEIVALKAVIENLKQSA